ncbi:MAG: Nramp family divalent metal transporter [Pseudolabrys sp.]|jgi:NRAMP (natural resistance-associated macrophage protein)-like metal ion transporter
MTKPSQPGLLRRVARALGPGLITGAADDDPSGIITYSMAGAQHGMALLWLAWITWPLMAAVQMMCARIGMVTGKGLGEVLTLKFPRAVVVVACCALFMANTINIAADLAGMADAASMLVGLRPTLYVVLFGAGIAVAMVRCRYAVIAAVLKWLVLSLFAYVVTAFLVHPNWPEVASATFIPTLPEGPTMWQTVVAILGTTISPYLFFWQASQEVEEQTLQRRYGVRRRPATEAKLVDRMLDVGAGTFLSNLIMFFIILTAALTLHAQGKTEIATSREAAEALRPLAGDFAVWLYAVAIIAVGLLSIPTLAGSAGYAFGETLRWPNGLDKKLRDAVCFYTTIILSVAIAVLIDFLKIDPIQSLFWSAIVNGVLAPFLLVGILLSARDPRIMKKQPSSVAAQAIVGVTTLAMFGAAGVMLWSILQGG